MQIDVDEKLRELENIKNYIPGDKVLIKTKEELLWTGWTRCANDWINDKSLLLISERKFGHYFGTILTITAVDWTDNTICVSLGANGYYWLPLFAIAEKL